MKNENAKKQRSENGCIVDLPLLCLDLICSYMTGYSLLAVHEALPLSYSSLLKPLILERKKNDEKLRLILEHKNEVKTKGLVALKDRNSYGIPTFVESFLFWSKGRADILSLIKTVSEKDYFTDFVEGLFSYFKTFSSSLLKIEYLTEIEKNLGKSEIISCIIRFLNPCSFVTGYIFENIQFCDSEHLILS